MSLFNADALLLPARTNVTYFDYWKLKKQEKLDEVNNLYLPVENDVCLKELEFRLRTNKNLDYLWSPWDQKEIKEKAEQTLEFLTSDSEIKKMIKSVRPKERERSFPRLPADNDVESFIKTVKDKFLTKKPSEGIVQIGLEKDRPDCLNSIYLPPRPSTESAPSKKALKLLHDVEDPEEFLSKLPFVPSPLVQQSDTSKKILTGIQIKMNSNKYVPATFPTNTGKIFVDKLQNMLSKKGYEIINVDCSATRDLMYQEDLQLPGQFLKFKNKKLIESKNEENAPKIVDTMKPDEDIATAVSSRSTTSLTNLLSNTSDIKLEMPTLTESDSKENAPAEFIIGNIIEWEARPSDMNGHEKGGDPKTGKMSGVSLTSGESLLDVERVIDGILNKVIFTAEENEATFLNIDSKMKLEVDIKNQTPPLLRLVQIIPETMVRENRPILDPRVGNKQMLNVPKLINKTDTSNKNSGLKETSQIFKRNEICNKSLPERDGTQESFNEGSGESIALHTSGSSLGNVSVQLKKILTNEVCSQYFLVGMITFGESITFLIKNEVIPELNYVPRTSRPLPPLQTSLEVPANAVTENMPCKHSGQSQCVSSDMASTFTNGIGRGDCSKQSITLQYNGNMCAWISDNFIQTKVIPELCYIPRTSFPPLPLKRSVDVTVTKMSVDNADKQSLNSGKYKAKSTSVSPNISITTPMTLTNKGGPEGYINAQPNEIMLKPTLKAIKIVYKSSSIDKQENLSHQEKLKIIIRNKRLHKNVQKNNTEEVDCYDKSCDKINKQLKKGQMNQGKGSDNSNIGNSPLKIDDKKSSGLKKLEFKDSSLDKSNAGVVQDERATFVANEYNAEETDKVSKMGNKSYNSGDINTYKSITVANEQNAGNPNSSNWEETENRVSPTSGTLNTSKSMINADEQNVEEINNHSQTGSHKSFNLGSVITTKSTVVINERNTEETDKHSIIGSHKSSKSGSIDTSKSNSINASIAHTPKANSSCTNTSSYISEEGARPIILNQLISTQYDLISELESRQGVIVFCRNLNHLSPNSFQPDIITSPNTCVYILAKAHKPKDINKIYIRASAAYTEIWFLTLVEPYLSYLKMYQAASQLECQVRREMWKCRPHSILVPAASLADIIGQIVYGEKQVVPVGFGLQVSELIELCPWIPRDTAVNIYNICSSKHNLNENRSLTIDEKNTVTSTDSLLTYQPENEDLVKTDNYGSSVMIPYDNEPVMNGYIDIPQHFVTNKGVQCNKNVPTKHNNVNSIQNDNWGKVTKSDNGNFILPVPNQSHYSLFRSSSDSPPFEFDFE